MTVFSVGCGGETTTDDEKAADVEFLNVSLALELTTVDAYERGLAQLRGPMLAVGREFRGQELAHVDALTKTIRGLGGDVDAEANELESPRPRNEEEALVLAYEEENAALAHILDVTPSLQNAGPRALAAALAASHAQHLAILRQGLGAGLAAAAPEPFESGEEPPPTADGPQT